MDIKTDKLDALELAKELVRMETISAGGNEIPALEKIASWLEPLGFKCSIIPYDPAVPTRANLVAELYPEDPTPALCFGGHIDTVPFGDAPWDDAPLDAVLKDGRLYGRGTADMKVGLAAMICAVGNYADTLKQAGRNIMLQVYGCEELGLIGSRRLATDRPETLKNTGAVIIAEPTGNRPQFGHKGIKWFQFETKGITAHAAMPEQGENAINKLIPTLCALKDLQPTDSHPYLGRSTLVLSVLRAGLNTNSVPDKAMLQVDVRTVAGQDLQALEAKLKELAGPEVELSTVADVPQLWSDPDHPWCARVRKIVGEATGSEAGIACATFATDGAALRIALKDTPIIILGPGDQSMAHRTNEFVPLDELYLAEELYSRIIRDWYRL